MLTPPTKPLLFSVTMSCPHDSFPAMFQPNLPKPFGQVCIGCYIVKLSCGSWLQAENPPRVLTNRCRAKPSAPMSSPSTLRESGAGTTRCMHFLRPASGDWMCIAGIAGTLGVSRSDFQEPTVLFLLQCMLDSLMMFDDRA